MMGKAQSPEAKARRRNSNAAKRAPLFAWAGLISEVTAQQVVYDDLARAIASYEQALDRERRDNAQYAVYVAMLDEAIGVENREEVIADMLSRGNYIRNRTYQIDFLCRYLAAYLKRSPLEVWEAARKRLDGLI